MNRVCLVGRLARDPEVRYSQGENSTAIARFTLAVDRKYKKGNEDVAADFINIVVFGKRAEFVEKYFHKGNKIGIEGRIQTGSYTNKDGVKVYTTDVVADDVEFVESKNSSGGDQAQASTQNAPEQAAPSSDGFMNIPDGIDEELPFN